MTDRKPALKRKPCLQRYPNENASDAYILASDIPPAILALTAPELRALAVFAEAMPGLLKKWEAGRGRHQTEPHYGRSPRGGGEGGSVSGEPIACPACNTDFMGSEIPEPERQWFGGTTHFLRVINVYDLDKDRTVAWKCPDCGHQWDRT